LANVGPQWGVLYSFCQKFSIILKAVVANNSKAIQTVVFLPVCRETTEKGRGSILWLSFDYYRSNALIFGITFLFFPLPSSNLVGSYAQYVTEKFSEPSSSSPRTPDYASNASLFCFWCRLPCATFIEQNSLASGIRVPPKCAALQSRPIPSLNTHFSPWN